MDWIAVLFSLGGLFLNAKKIIWCWPLWLVSNVFWIAYALGTKQLSIVITQAVFAAANWYAWKQWKKSTNS